MTIICPFFLFQVLPLLTSSVKQALLPLPDMIVLLTQPTAFPVDSTEFQAEAKIIKGLFSRGLQRLHVRKPGASTEELHSCIVSAIEPAYRDRVILHGCHRVAQALHVRGIHYTEKTRPADILPLYGPDFHISAAFHTLDQLRHPWGPSLKSCFLSPVFDSISKKDHRSAQFDRAELKAVLAQSPFPVFALGGVRADRLPDVQQMGFAGAAVIGAVWHSEDPLTAWQELHDVWNFTS